MRVALRDIQAAQARIRDGIVLSPCVESIALSEITGCRIHCKLDYLQRTGSFKERGARNALLLLDAARRRTGVIAASAGNHALGLAHHGGLLGVPVTVVMPAYAPLIKIKKCRDLGANVIVHGMDFPEAQDHAARVSRERGLEYIHGFDDPAIIAGQGTIGLEILEQTPRVEAVIVPIGGGGLIAGVALAIKSLRPAVQVIGVEAVNAPCFTAAMEAGRPVTVPIKPTLADGLAVSRVGECAFEHARGLVDKVVRVTEDALALAILRLLEMEKSAVEGAGAAPLAACLGNQLPELVGKHVVLAVCGANIDPITLSRVIEKGLVADGRLCRLTATIGDRPGALAHFAGVVASTGANFQEVSHDRTFSPEVAAVRVTCTVETRDAAHLADVYARLLEAGIEFVPARAGQNVS